MPDEPRTPERAALMRAAELRAKYASSGAGHDPEVSDLFEQLIHGCVLLEERTAVLERRLYNLETLHP